MLHDLEVAVKKTGLLEWTELPPISLLYCSGSDKRIAWSLVNWDLRDVTSSFSPANPALRVEFMTRQIKTALHHLIWVNAAALIHAQLWSHSCLYFKFLLNYPLSFICLAQFPVTCDWLVPLDFFILKQCCDWQQGSIFSLLCLWLLRACNMTG